jgi:hypothetical protein
MSGIPAGGLVGKMRGAYVRFLEGRAFERIAFPNVSSQELRRSFLFGLMNSGVINSGAPTIILNGFITNDLGVLRLASSRLDNEIVAIESRHTLRPRAKDQIALMGLGEIRAFLDTRIALLNSR